MHHTQESVQELIKELEDLKKEYNNIKTLYANELIKQKLTEESLLENNSRLEFAMQSAEMAWWIMDILTGNVTFSRRKTDMLGYQPENFTHYNHFMDLVHPADYDKAMNAMLSHFYGDADKYEVEYRIKTNSFDYKWFYDIGSIVRRDETGRPLKIAGFVIDVTKRKLAEIALTESESKYKSLVTFMEVGVIRSGTDDNITLANLAAANMFGYSSSDEMIGMPVVDLFETSLGEQMISDIEKSASLSNYEIRTTTKNNIDLFLSCNIKKIISPDYGFAGSEWILKDISILKKAEQKLREDELKLKELNATKDKFFSILAHDLRNPFHGIMGVSEFMKKPDANFSREDIFRFAELINNTSKSAYKLLENLLEWSRTQTGSLEFKPEKLSFTDLLNEVKNLTQNMANAKEISVTARFTGDFNLYADKNMVNTILRNLVTNAIKFTHRGGNIFITASPVGSDLEISIGDNGVGMDEDTLSGLFKISEKVTHPGTDGESGTGLGLLLCREFVLRHNGRIMAESEPGKGSTFKFTMPLFRG